VIAVSMYYPPVETWLNYGIILFFVAYVAVLVYLFSQFYVHNYLHPKKSSPRRQTSNTDVENIKDIKTE
jgi:preprotein translocase subunit SecY